jgi:ZIP family zinc transporter
MTFLSTSLGGLLALRVRDRLHLLLGFSSGAILGVVLFDLLPEVAERANDQQIDLATVLLFTAAGFLVFFALERVTRLYSACEHEHQGELFRTKPSLGSSAQQGYPFTVFWMG